KLIEGTACGVGILLGGEPDLHQYLHDAGIAASLHLDVTSAEPLDDEQQQEAGASLLAVLPWKHLAAVLGLVILIWLFWPADDNTDAAVQPLALPVPEKSAAVQQEEREPSPAPESSDPVAAAALESIHTPVAEPEPKPAPAPAKPATQAKPAPAPEKPLTGLAAQLGYQQEEWLLTQSSGQWMLQVALAANEDNARQLLD